VSARDEILARLRARPARAFPLPEVYRSGGRPADVVDLFIRRAADAGAEVVVTSPLTWPDRLVADLRGRGVRRAAVWEDPLLHPVVASLQQAGVAVVGPADHTPENLDTCDVGLTTADAAVASSGTVVVACGPGRPRATSLLPALHVAVLAADRVVATLEDLLAALPASVPSALTLISGPSRTADIELVPVRGVHGPTGVLIYLIRSESEEAQDTRRPGGPGETP
jgi:L-lactate dehydrogenase complex protein LldG